MIFTIINKIVNGAPAGYSTIIVVLCFMPEPEAAVEPEAVAVPEPQSDKVEAEEPEAEVEQPAV